ncbi:MAG TPA: site-2 protease family protein, partial [Candidatus Lokiarchaeia archaeon]
IHELCHSLMAQHYKLKVSEIELFLFGGVSKIEEEPKTPKSEFYISAVGPLSSLIMGLTYLILYFLFPKPLPTWILVTFYYSGITNFSLGVFNLLPAFPMDGGRVLRAYLWNRRKDIISATKTATKIGKFLGYVLVALGILQLVSLGQFGGLWLIFIGLFLASASKKSYAQTVNEYVLTHIYVKNISVSQKYVLHYELPLIDALKDYFANFNQLYYPVVSEPGKFVGILHLDDIKNIPIEERSKYIVGNIMRNIALFPVVYYEETSRDVIKKFSRIENSLRIAVIKESEIGNIINFLSEKELMNALKNIKIYKQEV